MLVQPFGFLSTVGANVITQDLLHWYNGSAESFQFSGATSWDDIGNPSYLNNLTADNSGMAGTFDGQNMWWNFNSTNIRLSTQIAAGEALTGQTGYTIEAWVVYNGNNLSTDDKGMVSLFNFSSSTQNQSFYLTMTTNGGANNGKAQAYIGGATVNPGHHLFGTSIGLNTWGHIAYTIETGTSNNLKLYTNGQPDGTVSVTWSSYDIIQGLNHWVLAEGNNSQNRRFAGYVGVVRNYNRALTADEILNNYNAGIV